MGCVGRVGRWLDVGKDVCNVRGRGEECIEEVEGEGCADVVVWNVRGRRRESKWAIQVSYNL